MKKWIQGDDGWERRYDQKYVDFLEEENKAQRQSGIQLVKELGEAQDRIEDQAKFLAFAAKVDQLNEKRINELETENNSLKRLIVKLKKDLEKARHVD